MSPTPAGFRLLLLLVAMGFAAVNTRNNLLYLMFSVGSAAVVVSVVPSLLLLWRVALRAGEPVDFYAGAAATEHFRARNLSRWFEGYAMEVEELDFPGVSPRAVLVHVGRAAEASVALEKSYQRRGIFETERLRVTTWFPFGLFRTARQLRLSRRLTVFPQVWPVDISFLFHDRLGPVAQRHGRGESQELLRLRSYSPGDNMRHIHWKATAKLGQLMIREFASEQRRRFTIVFDNRPPSPGQDIGNHDGFEAAVSAAASLALHLASHDVAFRFASADVVLSHDASPAHLRGVLSHLATVGATSRPGNDLIRLADEALAGEDIVLVVPGFDDTGWKSLSSPALHLVHPQAITASAKETDR